MLLLEAGKRILPYEESIWLCMYLQQHDYKHFITSSCDKSHIVVITRKLIQNYDLCDEYTKSLLRNRLLALCMYEDYAAAGFPRKGLAIECPEYFNVK
jgi:hypothetical protein